VCMLSSIVSFFSTEVAPNDTSSLKNDTKRDHHDDGYNDLFVKNTVKALEICFKLLNE